VSYDTLRTRRDDDFAIYLEAHGFDEDSVVTDKVMDAITFIYPPTWASFTDKERGLIMNVVVTSAAEVEAFYRSEIKVTLEEIDRALESLRIVGQ
jgi:hypothetical protein